ncbi:MAG TPA: hypothetical protein VEJ86_05515, partial [Candidatus Binataceae bacterium]|nr:hypothetical protein [Candidatus Binataceae bacterium]
HARIGAAQLFDVRDDNFEMAFYYGAPVKPLFSLKGAAVPIDSRPAYLVAYQGEIDRLPPDDRARLKLVMRAPRAGRTGDVELYAVQR